MTELEEAIVFANYVLDRPYADPDDELSLLARQFLRTRERLEAALIECDSANRRAERAAYDLKIERVSRLNGRALP